MKKVIILFLTCFLIVTVLGCVGKRGIRTTAENYPEKNAQSVKIYLAELPSVPYKAIGIAQTAGFVWLPITHPKSGDTMLEELKDRAASIGGDAIINITGDFNSLSGVVIVFTDKQGSRR